MDCYLVRHRAEAAWDEAAAIGATGPKPREWRPATPHSRNLTRRANTPSVCAAKLPPIAGPQGYGKRRSSRAHLRARDVAHTSAPTIPKAPRRWRDAVRLVGSRRRPNCFRASAKSSVLKSIVLEYAHRIPESIREQRKSARSPGSAVPRSTARPRSHSARPSRAASRSQSIGPRFASLHRFLW